MSRQKGSRILFCEAKRYQEPFPLKGPEGATQKRFLVPFCPPGTFLPCRPPVKRVPPPLGERTGARAFTLVELITVMGILVILAALIVGAAQGLHDRTARDTTVRILAALDAALQRYYDDWGKFPWYKKERDANLVELLGPVAGALDSQAEPSYCPVPLNDQDTGMETKVGAMLYAALNMRERNGPYISGGASKEVRLKSSQYRACRVYVDGWGRPIHYFQPQKDVQTGILMAMPLLMSEGRTKDIFNENLLQGDIWPKESKADNLTNYDLHDMNITSLQIGDSRRDY